MVAGGGQLFRPARQRLRLRLHPLRIESARQRRTDGTVSFDARAAARQRGTRDAAADAKLPARPGLASPASFRATIESWTFAARVRSGSAFPPACWDRRCVSTGLTSATIS